MSAHNHNPHLHKHPTRNGQKLHHKLVHVVHQQHGKPHRPPHRVIKIHLGKDAGFMAMVHSFQKDDARKKHEFGEFCEVVVHGFGTFYVTISDAMIRLLNALGSIHFSGGAGSGGAHPSSNQSSLPWWDRKWQEYCDETFRQAEREHHH